MKDLNRDDLKVIDFYNYGHVVRFYLGDKDLKGFYGDDWNDTPYEHNAGTVYDKFVKGYVDIAWSPDYYVCEPCEGYCNSPYCKDDFVDRKAPVIITKKKSDNDWSWDISKFDDMLKDENIDAKIYIGDLLCDVVNKGIVINYKLFE